MIQAQGPMVVRLTEQRQALSQTGGGADDTFILGDTELEVLVGHPRGLGRGCLKRIRRIQMGKARNGTQRKTNTERKGRGKWDPGGRLRRSRNKDRWKISLAMSWKPEGTVSRSWNNAEGTQK